MAPTKSSVSLQHLSGDTSRDSKTIKVRAGFSASVDGQLIQAESLVYQDWQKLGMRMYFKTLFMTNIQAGRQNVI